MIELEGLVVQSPSDHMWPFNRAALVVGEELRFARAPGWAFRDLDDQPVRQGPLRLVRYRAVLVWTTVLWLSVDPPVGFVAYRKRALRAALAGQRWSVDVETTWRRGPVLRIMVHVSPAGFAAGGVLVLDVTTVMPSSCVLASDESGSEIRTPDSQDRP